MGFLTAYLYGVLVPKVLKMSIWPPISKSYLLHIKRLQCAFKWSLELTPSKLTFKGRDIIVKPPILLYPSLFLKQNLCFSFPSSL